MNIEDKISEKWPWNGEFLRLFLLMPSVVGITATLSLFPLYGFYALWFLTGIPIGILLYFIYGHVGQRVGRLKLELQDKGGQMAEGLLVIGKIQSPGIVVLRDREVELIPIVGERCRLLLSDIKSVGEGHWLPGKYVWGKRVFTLDASILNPLAFAVPESIGAQWSSVFPSGKNN